MINSIENDQERDVNTFILSMFCKIEIVQLQGCTSGSVIVSPKDALDLSKFILPKKVSRWEYKPNLKTGAKILHPSTIYDKGQNIYQSGIKFPNYCVTCMKQVEKYLLAEAKLKVQSNAKLTIDEPDSERAHRIFEGISNARYWLAIPYCHEHGLDSKSIGFEPIITESTASLNQLPLTLRFTNLEYSRLFEEANNIKGVWVAKSAAGRVLFNNPEEEAKMNSMDKGWKRKLSFKRILLQLLNWSSLFLVAIIISVVFIDFLNKLFKYIQGNLLLVILTILGFLVVMLPWIIIAVKINKIGNFPFGKENKKKE